MTTRNFSSFSPKAPVKTRSSPWAGLARIMIKRGQRRHPRQPVARATPLLGRAFGLTEKGERNGREKQKLDI